MNFEIKNKKVTNAEIAKYNSVISQYPKKRIILSEEYKKVYNEHYIANREGAGLFNYISQKMESWMHKKVSTIHCNEILELGAGNLNHIKYEKSFVNYDIIEPFKELYQNSINKKSIRNIYDSSSRIKYKYDKIISIATLEHLIDLPTEIKRCKDLLKDDGVFQVAIPCEGEFAFKLGWMLTTALSFRIKYNLNYSKLIEYEHVNSIDEIITILNHHFRIVKFQRSPFILPIKNLSFYAYIECNLY